MSETKITRIECTVGCRYAVVGKPHLPQTILKKDWEYDIPEDITEEQAANAIKNEWANDRSDERAQEEAEAGDEEGTSSEDGGEAIDLDNATVSELKEYVQADADMDEAIDLRLNKAELVEAIKAYLAEQSDENS